EGGGQRHQDAVDTLEAACREALVLDAVLSADHGQLTAAARLQVQQRALRVLRLHRQDDGVVRGELDLVRMAHGRHRQPRLTLRRAQQQTGHTNRVEVRAAADQDYIVPGPKEARADAAADRARAVDDVPHRSTPSGQMGSSYYDAGGRHGGRVTLL